MRKKFMFITAAVMFLLLFSLAGCGKKEETQGAEEIAEEIESDVLYTVGIASFDPESSEMKMFMNYYRDYIAEGFPVKFYFSEKLSSAEDEIEFIHAMKEKGAQGIISFYGLDVKSTAQACQEDGMYYVLGSGTISDADFEAVKDNPWFLGTVGPDPEEEYRAGKGMAGYFAEKDVKNCLVLTGGAASGNFMHASRTRGILEGLAEKEGLSYGESVEELAGCTEILVPETGNQEFSVTLCPGYMTAEEGQKNLEEALEMADYDAVLCAYNVDSIQEKLDEKEGQQGKNLMVGTVDCFSEENFQLVKDSDAYGNPRIDYVEGKYASMAGPAFAMLYNAMSGHPEANSADGKAVRLYQGFWSAGSREEYAELYGYTQGIYENAYSCSDLMQVIKVFHEEASPESLKELTEAYTVEDVKQRILSH